jgi:predicted phage replisome organizer
MAGKCNESGYIFLTENIPYTEDYLAFKFKKSINIVKLALQTFQNFNMININEKGIQLINWSKYQNLDGLDKIKEKDRARIRKQKQRDRIAEKDMSSECHSDSHGTITVTPSIIEEEKELDIELDKDIEKEGEREIDTSSYQQVVDNFNKICKSLPKTNTLEEDTKKFIQKSFSNFKDIKAFSKVFKKVEESDFLSGRSNRWGGCGFSWCVMESNMKKILSGNYDNVKDENKARGSFNDYDQREYDYEDLEKKLLGWDSGNG